jgi:hypothetical protein
MEKIIFSVVLIESIGFSCVALIVLFLVFGRICKFFIKNKASLITTNLVLSIFALFFFLYFAYRNAPKVVYTEVIIGFLFASITAFVVRAIFLPTNLKFS